MQSDIQKIRKDVQDIITFFRYVVKCYNKNNKKKKSWCEELQRISNCSYRTWYRWGKPGYKIQKKYYSLIEIIGSYVRKEAKNIVKEEQLLKLLNLS